MVFPMMSLSEFLCICRTVRIFVLSCQLLNAKKINSLVFFIIHLKLATNTNVDNNKVDL